MLRMMTEEHLLIVLHYSDTGTNGLTFVELFKYFLDAFGITYVPTNQRLSEKFSDKVRSLISERPHQYKVGPNTIFRPRSYYLISRVAE